MLDRTMNTYSQSWTFVYYFIYSFILLFCCIFLLFVLVGQFNFLSNSYQGGDVTYCQLGQKLEHA